MSPLAQYMSAGYAATADAEQACSDEVRLRGALKRAIERGNADDVHELRSAVALASMHTDKVLKAWQQRVRGDFEGVCW